MIHWIYLIPAVCIGWAVAILCTCCQSNPEITKQPNSKEDTMFKAALKRILKHLENRRKWNRTKRWMQEHALDSNRMTVGLMASGTLRLWK